MNKKNSKKFKADNFWARAHDIIDSTQPDSDIRKENVTDLWYHELDKRIQNGELINININGNVRLGKSTAAIAEMVRIKQRIEHYRNIKRPLSVKHNIHRDQNEYARAVKLRKETFKHECDVIDEWSELEYTGYNASIEQKNYTDFSDRQASRYYHRIACSPKKITDDNCDLILHIVPGSREKGRTLCLLYYRMLRGNYTDDILMGHVIIDVTNVLNKPWYQEYLQRKEEKYELINKHNIKSARTLEYARIILDTFKHNRKRCELGAYQKSDFKNTFERIANKYGIFFSILGDDDILKTLESMGKLAYKIKDVERKMHKAKTSTEKKTWKEYYDELTNDLKQDIAHQNHYINLWERYQKI